MISMYNYLMYICKFLPDLISWIFFGKPQSYVAQFFITDHKRWWGNGGFPSYKLVVIRYQPMKTSSIYHL